MEGTPMKFKENSQHPVQRSKTRKELINMVLIKQSS